MHTEIRKKHTEKYGSFLRCPKRGNLCMGMYTDDPEYIKLQEKIEERRKALDLRRIESKEKAMHAFEAPKRANQEKELAGYMARREHTARRYYMENKPKRADKIMQEVLILQARLRTMKKGR